MIKLRDNYGQEVDFQFPEESKNICVNVSGGLDSALLLYMAVLQAEKQNKNLFLLTCSSAYKNNYNALYASKVVSKVMQMTNTDRIKLHYTEFVKKQHRRLINQLECDMIDRYNIDTLMNASTQNPAEDAGIGEGEPRRNPGHKWQIIQDYPLRDVKIFLPFILVDKRLTCAGYKQLDLLDTLLPVTRSCEGFVDINTTCKDCWWCKERKWGLESIGMNK